MVKPTFVAALAFGLLWLPAVSTAQPPPAPPDDAAMEAFLLKGRIVRTRSAGKGVTGSIRATLTLGDVTHDAHVQTVDQSLREFKSAKGTEFNFRDKWQFNLAAYKLDRLMDLRLVPVTVERRFRTEPASFTWWVDDVLMDEGERIKQKVEPPVPDCWNEQMQQLRMFDQLIENTDRNLGNVVISTTWRVWAIDHTRAFRRSKVPPKPANLTRVDRGLLDRLARLDFDTLKRSLKAYLDDHDLRALLSRRDAIVAHFRARGEQALYDRRDLSSGCHAEMALAR
jgi:hypothetical protein